MRGDIAKKLANFVRRRRGQMTLKQFSRKSGLSLSTLSRLESQSQNITVKSLQQLVNRLGCDVQDLFKES